VFRRLLDRVVSIGYGVVYDYIWEGFPPYQDLQREVYELVERAVPERANRRDFRILELACGTGTGTFEAEIQMKVQGDNPMDSPELVVIYATIKGSLQVRDSKFRRMSIQNAVLTITHVLDPRTMSYVLPAAAGLQTTYSTTGTVRLPFLYQSGGKGKKKEKNDSYGSVSYLDDDGRAVNVKDKEISLGTATARFELNFQGSF
jgi:hypothetical protein